MLLKSTTYSHDNDVCSTRDTTISTWYPQFRLRLRMFCSDAEITEINQKIIISLQENKRLIWRAAMACSAAITMLFRTRVYQSNVSNENPDSVNFPVDGFQRRRIPGCRSAGNKEKTQLGRWRPRGARSRLSPDPRTPTRCVQNYCWLKALLSDSLEGPAADRRRSRWNCVWRFRSRREFRWRRRVNCAPLLCELCRGHLKLSITFRWIHW